jgi:Tfp pilus assembly protein PilF
MRTVLVLVLLLGAGCAPRKPPRDAAAAPLLEELARNPDDVPARLALAETRRAAGDYEGALIEAYKALASDPHSADAHALRARIYFERGIVEREVEAWRAAVSAAPDRVELRENLAHSLVAAGRAREAEEEYRAVLALRPDAKASIWNLALLAEDAGNRDEAKRLWARYLEVDPSGEWADRARAALEAAP